MLRRVKTLRFLRNEVVLITGGSSGIGKELAFEGHRIYDIMRYKSALDRGANCNTGICKLSYPNDLFILPIPKSELDANNLIKPNPTVNN